MKSDQNNAESSGVATAVNLAGRFLVARVTLPEQPFICGAN